MFITVRNLEIWTSEYRDLILISDNSILKFLLSRGTGYSKTTPPHKRRANKGKKALPLPEPFSSKSSSHSTGSSQTKKSPVPSK
ncbi:hypothetical protein ACOSQ2_015399 [Xanthoceras sorbifolium]